MGRTCSATRSLIAVARNENNFIICARQIKSIILELSIRRTQSNFSIVFIFLLAAKKKLISSCLFGRTSRFRLPLLLHSLKGFSAIWPHCNKLTCLTLFPQKPSLTVAGVSVNSINAASTVFTSITNTVVNVYRMK